MENNDDKYGHLRAMIFTTSALLFLMIFGAGIAVTADRFFEFAKRGEITTTTAWSVSIGIGLLGVFMAGFVAHYAIAFVDLVARGAAKETPPSNSRPPRPRKRTLRLVA